MGSWGIAGGAAVKSYQDAEKLARDSAWEDQQRAEWARIRDQNLKMDAAVNGDEAEVDARYKVPDVGLPVAKMGQGLEPNAPKETPLDPMSIRAHPDGNGGYVPTSKAPKKPSEDLIERAARLKRSGTGAAGLKMAMELEQHAVGLAKQEQEQELTGIVRSRMPAEQKIEALVRYIDDSPMVPGSAAIVQGKDGLYLQHTVPGKKEPFRRKLEGSTPEEAVQNMALMARAMTDPSLAMKRKEYQLEEMRTKEQGRHNIAMESAASDRTAASIEIANMRAIHQREMADARQAARANWQVLGQDDDGVAVSFDRTTNTMIRQDGKPPKNATKFWQKITGEKPAAEYTPTQLESIKTWRKWQSDNPDATGAQDIAMATRFGVPQELAKDPVLAALAGKGDPFAKPKGLPAKPAPAAARGLPAAAPQKEDAAIAGLMARVRQLDPQDPANVEELKRLGTLINQRRQQLGQFN